MEKKSDVRPTAPARMESSAFVDPRLVYEPKSRAGKSGGEEEFNRLALALFAFQRENVPIYRELCERRKAGPESIRDWREIPPLPTSAFKEYEVSSIPAGERTRVFHSSGTTGQVPSRHFHNAESLSVYEASLLPWFQRHFFATQPAPMNFFSDAGNGPAFLARPHVHDGAPPFWHARFSVHGRVEADGAWSLDLEQTLAAVREAVGENRPLGLLGTAFSFVQLLDHLQSAGKRFALPKGSRVMETGGYKGRTRTVPKAQLRRMLAKFLGVPAQPCPGRIRHERIEFAGLRQRGRRVPFSAVGARLRHLPRNRRGLGRRRNRIASRVRSGEYRVGYGGANGGFGGAARRRFRVARTGGVSRTARLLAHCREPAKLP
jgi:hypothetical protein